MVLVRGMVMDVLLIWVTLPKSLFADVCMVLLWYGTRTVQPLKGSCR